MAEISDYSEGNRTHFDHAAHKYDEKSTAIKIAGSIARAMLKDYEFDEDSTRVMDFACGTGLLSRELAPYVKSIIGVDISQGMVDQYNLRVAHQGIPPEDMRAICVDIGQESLELGGGTFDVIVCARAYHHFPDIDGITRTLAQFLRPGGTLLVSDLLHSPDSGLFGCVERDSQPPPQGESADANGSAAATQCSPARGAQHPPLTHSHPPHGAGRGPVVAHVGGLAKAAVAGAFAAAGLVDFAFRPASSVTTPRGSAILFLARGCRPSDTG